MNYLWNQVVTIVILIINKENCDVTATATSHGIISSALERSPLPPDTATAKSTLNGE